MTDHGTSTPVVDADGHVLEQLELDADLRAEYLTRIVGEGVSLVTPAPGDDPYPAEDSHAEVMNRPGAYEPEARLKDMDVEGIDVAVLYPTTPGLGFVPDAERHGRMCRAYNDWLHEFCSAEPSRLVGVGLVPLQDPAAAVKEMERAVGQLGFKAVMIRPAPYIGRKKFNDPVYDPFWDAAEALGCPVGVHPFSFPDMPNTVSLLGLDEDSEGNPSKGLTLKQGLGNALDVMVAMGWFVAGGICERYPRLVVAFLEGSGGWCAPMLERFDHHLHVFGSRYQSTPPSEVFRRQCYISFDPDEEALAYTANSRYVGADRIIWASDYPHPDAKIPGVVEELREATESLDDEQRQLVMGGNAMRLYQL
ncbi:MAG TPA: amidohydrolase family protein [Acidimicrobiales bacterium]|nr:amidohydrolase family protein [Acidimicrobiales bacterium]